MNVYINKICPYCKTKFNEDDEVVVCSVCDMPHHKECWVSNKGCTTFGCLGTIKQPDDAPSSVTAENMVYEDSQPQTQTGMYCGKCGAPNSAENLFCVKCGNPLKSQAQQNESVSYAQFTDYQSSAPTVQEISLDPDLGELIANNSEYYLSQFSDIKSHNKKVAWNWSAFLFAPFWFIYRKMYVYGVAFLAAILLISVFNFTLGSFLALGGNVVSGLFGNYLYCLYLEKKLPQFKTTDDLYKTQFVLKYGGINKNAVTLTAICYLVLMIVIFLISFR